MVLNVEYNKLAKHNQFSSLILQKRANNNGVKFVSDRCAYIQRVIFVSIFFLNSHIFIMENEQKLKQVSIKVIKKGLRIGSICSCLRQQFLV